jgi:putative drug exporter of the RND superfamily
VVPWWPSKSASATAASASGGISIAEEDEAVFGRLGRWCYDHRWKVVGVWVAALVVGGVALTGAGGSQTNADFSLPDVESKRGIDILDESFGGQGAGSTGTIVFGADAGVDDPEVRSAMGELFDEVAGVEGITSVASPYGSEGADQIAREGPDAGQVAYAEVELSSDLDEAEVTEAADAVKDIVPNVDGVDIELGGFVFADFEDPSSEILGVGFAVVILILAFGSVLAMGLPIGVALAGIGVGSIVAGFISFLIHPPSFAALIGIMIGLGVGIDYALFIVTRYRENLRKGHDTRTSVSIAIDTAGRAVLFAGTTVVISLLGMVLMNLGFVTGLAVSAATVVAATMVASLTLLPALLGFAGSRVEVTRWRGLIAAGGVAVGLVGVGLAVPALLAVGLGVAIVVIAASFAVAPLRREVPRPAPKPLPETASYRWSRLIQRHPWAAALSGATALVLLALPLFAIRLGTSDEGNFAEDTTTRQAYDMLSEGFGPGHNGPLLLATELPDGTDPADLERVTDAVGATDGVAFASAPRLGEQDDAAVWQVIPTTAPQDKATTELVHHLRDDVLPAATAGTGLDPAVTGNLAVNIDFADYLAERLPYFLAAVLVTSFLLLLVVFRSLLVPLKAVIMNLLSIGAAYGVIVAGFQWGWLGGLLNFEGGPIEPWIPMMLFAIVFGLSMDYEVFLLSRVREEWHRTGDSRTSVADGLAATARVITAAALIMVFVFGSFLLEDDRVIKLMGVGLATAVLLDATIVRMLLVPATMELLGDRNWWLPRWLDRLLPRIDVEGGHEEGGDEPTAPAPTPEPDPDSERVPEPV